MSHTRNHLRLMAVLAAMIISSAALGEVMPLSEMIESRTMKLSELIARPDTRIRSGDKVFDNFSYSATGEMPDAENVEVIPIRDRGGNYGLRFQGAFLDLPGGGGSDALITFDAAVMPASGMLISDAHLAMNGAPLGGRGFASVVETFLPLVDDAFLAVYNFGTGDTKLTDWVVFDKPLPRVSVQKDILLFAGGSPEPAEPEPGQGPGPDPRPGVVVLSFVDQTFSQVPVPEPASCVLLLTGLWALTAIAIRRRAR